MTTISDADLPIVCEQTRRWLREQARRAQAQARTWQPSPLDIPKPPSYRSAQPNRKEPPMTHTFTVVIEVDRPLTAAKVGTLRTAFRHIAYDNLEDEQPTDVRVRCALTARIEDS